MKRRGLNWNIRATAHDSGSIFAFGSPTSLIFVKARSQHMNWVELTVDKSTQFQDAFVSLVTRVIVTTWLAAAKLGRLVPSQFVRCEHSR